MIKIDVEDYGIYPNSDDNTLKVYNIIKDLNNESATIQFGPGIYHFYPEYAIEKMLYISNHEDGTRKIAFPIINKKDIKIKGDNTKFIFHMDIIPFYIHHSENIEISGITIDYNIPGYAEADILSVDESEMTLKIDRDKYPYEIINNQYYSTAENLRNKILCCLEMDPKTWAPTYNLGDDWFGEYPHVKFEDLGDNKVKICAIDKRNSGIKRNHNVGNKLILRSHDRTHPGFYLTDSKNISINNIDVYHCTGMGVIAQHTKDITLDNFNIKIDEKNKRIFTAVADATHFVYCYGKIIINNCLFENQLDDPVNVHGIYGQVNKIISSSEFIIKLVEKQQKGVRIGKIGEELSLVNNETLLSYGSSKIKEIEMLNADYTYIRLEDSFEGIKIGHVVENLEYVPDVTISNCVFRNNRARGPLLTSAGNVVVKNNYFNIPGAAILIEGDANYWFESGATKSITIENNIFFNCSYVKDWGEAPIQVTPKITKIEDGVRYHKNLVVKNNEFHCFDNRILYACSVENIEFTNNKIIKTEAYPILGTEKFVLKDVINFKEEN